MFVASFFKHQGVSHACISPGARNSPLTHAFLNNKNIRCFSNVDERSSAFFALGISIFNKKPVVIISTSGTAVANFFPAVIEANLSRVPIIILSADRPKHLVGTGANQTIDQQELFGNHVRFFKDVGLPSDNYNVLEDILHKSIIHSQGMEHKIPPGPIHLNFPFKEPLLSTESLKTKSLNFTFKPFVKFEKSITSFDILPKSVKPLIIMGPINDNYSRIDVISLAEKINAPILADPLSQIRYGNESHNIISHYDIFLKFLDVNPDLILRFGRKPTSKILCQLLDQWRNQTYLVDAWQKYNDDCLNFIQAPIDEFCKIQESKIDWNGSMEWLGCFYSFDGKVNKLIQLESKSHEGMISRTCYEALKDGDQFIIGNSMPIRDVDMFTSNSKIKIHTFANRGASGIDGVLSTALGISIFDIGRNSLLLLGDLSFFHDMNGLLASRHQMDITIVVVNNGGGGIFSFLPIANMEMENFNEYWTTNTGLDLKKAADLHSCSYYKADNLEELKQKIQGSFDRKGVNIIEVQTDIEENVQDHHGFMEKVEKELSSF